jgi:NAD(P)-dependent dehydrogenase (short-subunit alcohol dehydrogenase family)
MATTLFDLSGKKALVTGASKGIGYTIAVELAKQGADLIVTSRTRADLNPIVQIVQKMGRTAYALCADLNQHAEVVQLAKEALSIWPTLDILVNNAGVNVLAPATEAAVEDWEVILNTNLRAPFFLAQRIVQPMIRQQWGRIINISSQCGLIAIENHVAYCASKGGMELMTKVCALEWAPYGVTVNTVAPTVVDTPLTRKVINTPEKLNEMLRRIPVGRFATCEEVTGAVIYLASNAAAMVTGDCLRVDGGWTVQ